MSDPPHWETACALLGEPLRLLHALPPASVLSLNAPALPADQLRGLRWATLDRFGRVRVALTDSSSDWLQMEYHANDRELDPGSDTALLEQGFATLTAIQGASEVSLDEAARSSIGHERPETRVTRVPETKA